MYRNKFILFILFQILCNTLFSQNTLTTWKGWVQIAEGVLEPEEKTCDFIQNGELRIAPNLSGVPNYVTTFRFQDTICISRNFSLEYRIKNSEATGGLNNLNSEISFFSNGLKTSLVLTGKSAGQSTTAFSIANETKTLNQPWMNLDLSRWRTVKMTFLNSVASVFIDDTLRFTSPYVNNVCNIDILDVKFQGSGALDWVKFYDNENTLVFNENFDNCQKLTRGINCDPSVPISLKTSPACDGDTLTMCANFPAMSYVWSDPAGNKIKMPCISIPNLTNNQSGKYAISANINNCFTFTKTIDISAYPKVRSSQNISLCAGQSFKLSKGRVITVSGVYYDTLKTIRNCDSIVLYNIAFGAVQKDSISVEKCLGQCYTFITGKRVCATGIFRDTVKEASGCQREYIVNLKLTNALMKTQDAIICQGNSFRLPSGVMVNTTNIYRDTFKTLEGCDSIVVTNLKVESAPKPELTGASATEYTEGASVTLTTQSINGAGYEWFVNALKTNELSNIKTLNLIAGENVVKVIVKTVSGCVGETSITLFGTPKVSLPNAFTPNGDGLNDRFSIVTTAVDGYFIIEKFQVFNRLGNKIYDNENGLKGWNGQFKNDDCATDTYVYFMEVVSKSGSRQKFSGEVLLLR
jgi:gliding motility-associated-like protein